jgi:hypothetical protein
MHESAVCCLLMRSVATLYSRVGLKYVDKLRGWTARPETIKNESIWSRVLKRFLYDLQRYKFSDFQVILSSFSQDGRTLPQARIWPSGTSLLPSSLPVVTVQCQQLSSEVKVCSGRTGGYFLVPRYCEYSTVCYVWPYKLQRSHRAARLLQ